MMASSWSSFGDAYPQCLENNCVFFAENSGPLSLEISHRYNADDPESDIPCWIQKSFVQHERWPAATRDSHVLTLRTD